MAILALLYCESAVRSSKPSERTQPRFGMRFQMCVRVTLPPTTGCLIQMKVRPKSRRLNNGVAGVRCELRTYKRRRLCHRTALGGRCGRKHGNRGGRLFLQMRRRHNPPPGPEAPQRQRTDDKSKRYPAEKGIASSLYRSQHNTPESAQHNGRKQGWGVAGEG